MQELKGCLPGSKFQSLEGKTIMITGAGSGFGRSMALLCTRLGATVAISDINTTLCLSTESAAASPTNTKNSSITKGKCYALPSACDVTISASQEKFFEFAKEKFGGMTADIVVCNAGVTEIGQVTDTREKKTNSLGTYPTQPILKTLQINGNGMLLTAEIAKTEWQKEASSSPGGNRPRGPGKLILLASFAGVSGLPSAGNYSYAKHAIVGYWLGVCAELRRKQEKAGKRAFSCDIICPFFSATAILDKFILCVLAGVAKVEPDTIAGCLVALMHHKSEIGSAVFLPDDRDPWIASDLDFQGALLQDWSVVQRTRKGVKLGRKEYWQKFGGDVGAAFKLTPLKLVKVLGIIAASIAAMLFAHYSVASLSSTYALALGASAAVATTLIPKAKVDARPAVAQASSNSKSTSGGLDTVLIAFNIRDLSDFSDPSQYLAAIRKAATASRKRLIIFFGNPQNQQPSWTASQRFLGRVYTAAAQAANSQDRELLEVDVLAEGFSALEKPLEAKVDKVYFGDASIESHPFLSQIAKSCPSESIHLGSQPIDKTTKQATEPREQFDVVALGGTFDHLHAGHKILLTMATYLAKRKVIVGMSADTLLKSKLYPEFLESLDTRSARVKAFLELVSPGIEHSVVPLYEVAGPTGTDRDIQALVVSKESLDGGRQIAAIRKEKDLPPLRQFVIDVITAEDSANDLAAESDPLRLKELKMGSTYIRQELARRAGEGGRS